MPERITRAHHHDTKSLQEETKHARQQAAEIRSPQSTSPRKPCKHKHRSVVVKAGDRLWVEKSGRTTGQHHTPKHDLRAGTSQAGETMTDNHAKSNRDKEKTPEAKGKRVQFSQDTKPTASLDLGIDFSDTITLVAGEGSSAKFVVHKNLLANRSKYFEQMLRRSSNSNNAVTIPGVHAKGLNIYLQWLYSQEGLKYTLTHFSRAHVLGQRVGDTRFRNYCTHKISDLIQDSQCSDIAETLVAEVFPNAAETALGTLCADYLVWEGSRNFNADRYSKNERLRRAVEFATQAKRKRLEVEGRGAKAPYVVDIEKYYEAEEDYGWLDYVISSEVLVTLQQGG